MSYSSENLGQNDLHQNIKWTKKAFTELLGIYTDFNKFIL